MPGKLYNGSTKVVNCDSWGIRVTATSQIQIRFTSPNYTLNAAGSTVNSGNKTMAIETPNIYDGNWHHLAMMVTGKETVTPAEEEGGEPTVTESSEVRFYYDYIWRHTETIGWKIWYGAGEDLYIGAMLQTPGPFGGSIAHFRISDVSMYVADMLSPARLTPAEGEANDVFMHFAFEMPPTGPINSYIDESGRQAQIGMAQHMYEGGLSVPGLRNNVLMPSESLRPSLTNALSRTNTSVFYTRPIQGNESDKQRYISIRPEDDPFTNSSFTVECFYRSNTNNVDRYIPLVRRPGGSNVQFNLGFNPAGTLSGSILMTPSGSTSVNDIERTDDGEWHHAALVVDATLHRISIFRDYRRIKSSTYSGEVIPSTSPIYIGGSSDGNYDFNGWIDEVRITLRALESGEFLTSEEYFDPTTRTLAWATFDSDFVGAPALTSPTATNLTETGAIPAITSLSPELPVYDGLGEILRLHDTGALSIQTGSVTYAKAPLLSLFPDQTVEVRVRTLPQPYWASFLRANYAYLDSNPAWSFGFSNADADPITGLSTNLTIRCSTVNDNGGIDVYGINDTTGVNITDGRWHHLALTMHRFKNASGTTRTTVCLYKDYEETPSFTKTVNGAIYGNGHGEIKLGESSSSKYFTGEIDEVRISQGVLAPIEFLRVTTKGTVISVR